ncbi:LysR family transcriptional regulator [Streptomyces sp. MMG1121]|uniref:LysR family transcriptional regulator n=1 Tax=Streptomyces sp. MMG1121 TaxID=1415544 RepID=UPI000AA99BD8|nr:LysR family transcriptional regulator [Streptomyces sp. MMG1121]
MLLRQLEYLVALARERHFARAAAACYVSQPSLSAAIRRLEHELDVPIVRRGRRYEGLPPEGEVVLAWARRMLAERDALRQELSALRGGLTGTLRLGVVPTALPVVSLLTTAFCDRHPRAAVTLGSLSSAEIRHGLAEFELDAAMTYLDDDTLRQVRRFPLYEERYVLLTPVDGPLGGADAARWSQAATLPLCLLSPADAQPADHRRVLRGRRSHGRPRDRVGQRRRALRPSAGRPLVQRRLTCLAAHVRGAGGNAGGAAGGPRARPARGAGRRPQRGRSPSWRRSC